MIIDCHNHVLATALPPGHDRFVREMRAPGHRRAGRLPAYRAATDEDWVGLEGDLDPIDPGTLVDDHVSAGVDRATVLAVAPSTYTTYGERGTIDLGRVTDVDGPLEVAKSNDYIASLTRRHPELIGMSAVNPKFRGVEWARDELTRAVGELGLQGLKLYPMYDHYAPADRDLAFPIYERAVELGIGVMVHMGTSSAKDTVLDYGRPGALDEVARHFPGLPLLVCHAGFPWVDECLAMVARHDNTYLDISMFATKSTQRQLYDFLLRAQQLGCPLSRICWGTDYPGGGKPAVLLPKLTLVNDVADPGAPISRLDVANMVGGNWARFAGLTDWSEQETLEQLEAWEPRWRDS
ncbi:amidohydrolase family protein [Amycolatopsis sp. DSM 110486]|uniref:amidohydrolase family protein n=1 Tax=Amycolatopsis sp. DSM 110486 TaxID=2865832 RepID=UPI001C698724|nr:amidohydrolase family protein [Amycolatopsis sp. DSM 110486]QYN21379.1 amidohydrolase family protein [Amycolatopsis sp. DSM 110486]